MERREKVSYEQDRQGNERRKLDEHRAQDGMEQDDRDGVVSIEAGDVDSEVIVYELPDSAQRAILDEVHSYNESDTGATFSIFSASLDANGDIDTTTRRSVPIDVASTTTRIHSYSGKPFEADAIAVSSSFEGHIGLAVLADHEESHESASEQTEA